MKRSLIIILMIFTTSAFGQQYSHTQLDSLYNTYMQIREDNSVSPSARSGVHSESVNADKCGFGLVNIIRMNLRLFSPNQQAKLSKILSRPTTDTSIVSPKGYFRIHFYKPGGTSNPPAYDVNQFAIAADSAYDFEVGYLGYPPPPGDSIIDGENKYDIYIISLGNLYGQTNFETEVVPGSSRYYSYMEVDDDFAGFHTTGINAARVTVAHEFNHGIQLGNYIYRDSDVFFYELTSTAMETFVYPSIPDYLQYMNSYFFNSGKGFVNQTGYDMAIWDIYLKMNYGYDVIRREWELMRQGQRALTAINSSLVERNSSFAKAFNDFGTWTYYTNYRAQSGKYFPMASQYPLIRPLSSVSFNAPSTVVQASTKPATNNFVMFTNSANADTIVAQISNVDYIAGSDSSNKTEPVTYSLYNDLTSGSIKILDKYSASLTVSKSTDWLSGVFLNNVLVSSDTISVQPSLTEGEYAYPDPFYYSRNYASGSQIFIPVAAGNTGDAVLNVYSVSMNLVYTSTLGVFNSSGHPVVAWSGRNSRNERLATGVYIYVTKSGDNVVKGKLVIFNQ